VISTGVTKFPAFTLVRNESVFSNKLCVICSDRLSLFGILSSDVHGLWAWAQKTSLGGDLYSLVYAHGNVFETFPFPDGFLENESSELQSAGWELFDSRQAYMKENKKGLTKFYNEFHDPKKQHSSLIKVRERQSIINRVVFDLYNWHDLNPDCGFHEVSYLPAGNNTRFTIDANAQSEVRRRLSILNRDRCSASQDVGFQKSHQSAVDENLELNEEDDLFGRQDQPGSSPREGA
jgi:hypothetical protein